MKALSLKKTFRHATLVILLSFIYASPAPSSTAYAQDQAHDLGSLTSEQKKGLKQAGPLGDHALGNPRAPIKVVEYASLTCFHCAIFAEKTFPIIKRDYIKTGKVYYIYRDFPLDTLSLTAAMYAQCMTPDAFFPYINHLFQVQPQWVMPQKVDESFAQLRAITTQAGLSEKEITRCEANTKVRAHLEFVYTNAKDHLNVKGTPFFFINGQPFMAGDVLEQLQKLDHAPAAQS